MLLAAAQKYEDVKAMIQEIADGLRVCFHCVEMVYKDAKLTMSDVCPGGEHECNAFCDDCVVGGSPCPLHLESGVGTSPCSRCQLLGYTCHSLFVASTLLDAGGSQGAVVHVDHHTPTGDGNVFAHDVPHILHNIRNASKNWILIVKQQGDLAPGTEGTVARRGSSCPAKAARCALDDYRSRACAEPPLLQDGYHSCVASDRHGALLR